VAPDDLNAPLGQKEQADEPPARMIGVPQILAGLLAASILVVVGWAAFVTDPLGGEPVAVVATKSAAESGAAGPADGSRRHDGTEGEPAIAAAKSRPKGPEGQTVTIIDGSSGKRQEVVIPAKRDEHSSLAPIDGQLLQTTRHGAIPTIGPKGARPSSVYAKPRALSDAVKDFPRIAIIVGGMGISAAGTADAFSLPASVTFALAPYATDLDKLAQHARADGHELLLQVPMEPFDYPDNDPGPQTLLTSLKSEQNIDRLHWIMARFQGYVGLVSYMGARFTSSEQALRPVLHDAAARGLIYVDDGASPRSVAGQIAGAQNMPFAKADLSIDAVPDPADIEHALARLELKARENGSAIGIAAAQPVTVARIARWAKQVESRGFVLVPISMVALRASRREANRQ
jgi:polysaccharide deacetylase 2 family uncharacterized protein YibQ